VIGAILDKVYMRSRIPTIEGIQTVSVPAGGAVIAEVTPKVPGNHTLLDHAIARVERGLAGILMVEGPPNPRHLQRSSHEWHGPLDRTPLCAVEGRHE
jgi:nitrite reductase (NO-forming)